MPISTTHALAPALRPGKLTVTDTPSVAPAVILPKTVQPTKTFLMRHSSLLRHLVNRWDMYAVLALWLTCLAYILSALAQVVQNI